MITKRYFDAPLGQLHAREGGPRGDTPLVCLHATAYSSRTFEPLIGELADGRHAIAVDTPGYGESDAPAAALTMAGYADAIAPALAKEHGRIDLLGYHTGASIAVEMAIRFPGLVDRMILIGIPYFRALDFDTWRDALTERQELSDDLAQFAERWDYLVTRRPAGVALADGYRNFVDELKAWPHGCRAHEALFEHDLDARLPLVRRPVLVVNPAGHLAQPSRVAAKLIPGALVEEMPEMSGAVLETGAGPIAARIASFLDADLRVAARA